MSKKLELSKQISMIRKMSVVVYVALAIAAVFVMNTAAQQMRWFYQTADKLASNNDPVFASGSHFLVDIQYRFALVVVLLLAAVFTAVAFTKNNDQYAQWLRDKFVPLRWIGIGVTAALIMEIVAMICGMQDMVVLKVMAGSILATALLSGLAERENVGVRRPVWKAFTVAVITGVLPWMIVGGTMVGTYVYGGVHLPWYAYALAGIALAGFSGIAVNQFLSIKQYKAWQEDRFTERNYLLAGFVLKVAFAAVLIVAFKR
jgi:hypothetical protein